MKNKVIKVNYGYDKSNIKLLSVLAYIGPLFVMGLFAVCEKPQDSLGCSDRNFVWKC